MDRSPHIAGRMADIAPFHVMDLLARARELEADGTRIVHMEIGEPDFDSPEPVIRAGVQALERSLTHYTPAVGLSALREAISEFYARRYRVTVDPARIIVTPGASGALQLVMGVLVNPRDEVLMADPGYPCNRHFVRQYEGRACPVPVDRSSAYQLTTALLREHWSRRCVAALVATPSNPTGTLIPQAELSAMTRFTSERGAVLIVDEIYHGLTYGQPPETAAALGDNVFVVNSFSKYFGMTGWRLGWIVAPAPWVREIDKLAQNIFLAAPTLSQHAALAAFEPETLEILDGRREVFRERRDALLPALRDLGFDIPVSPQGAFYLYAGCGAFTDDSYAFSRRLLEEAGVAITPGIDFGEFRPASHVRFAYTTSKENLQEGVERLGRYLA
ncbi:MAG: pyridoxal phosphate-dependent aminotransferase [Gammaproteobacteria bacterium]|nr:pyridoxal phosphate-dependent aminotransferase [Gammaproteobacteria bacterium]